MNDLELLHRYERDQCEDSFAELVNRHVNFVYSVALRQVRSPELAEEIAQFVFMTMARNASKMKPDTILTAWLYRVTRRAAVNAVRGESRRRQREQVAVDLANLQTDVADWAGIEPLLDEAMENIDEAGRSAILLRFFDGKSFREVGLLLGISEEAARKRVSRAIEQLRDCFAGRGVAVSSAGLATVLAAHAVKSAPAGLGAAICASASVCGLHASKAIAIAKTIAMTTTQKALLTAAVAFAVGAVVHENFRVSGLRGGIEALQRQQEPLAADLAGARRERDEASNQLQVAQRQLQQLRHDTSELPRLRGELARWRDAANKLAQSKTSDAGAGTDPADSTAKAWASQVKQLRQRAEQWPDKRIPELQLATDQDWFDAVGSTNSLESDADYRQALDRLRRAAKNKLVPLLQDAMKKYADANSGQLPAELAQIQPFLDPSVDNAMLQRYQILQGGSVSNLQPNQPVLAEIAPVDDQYDERYLIMMSGAGASGW